MRSVLKVLSGILAFLYPFLIYAGLHYFNASSKVLVLLIVAVGTVYFLAYTDDAKGKGIRNLRFWGMITAVLILSVLTYLTENIGYAKLYPVIMNIFLLMSFSLTLQKGPNMIFRFATLQDKSILESEEKSAIENYCRKVTVVWIGFFIINGSIAFFTVFWADDKIWTLYNGFISYICMGMLFAIEWIVRKRVSA